MTHSRGLASIAEATTRSERDGQEHENHWADEVGLWRILEIETCRPALQRHLTETLKCPKNRKETLDHTHKESPETP